MLKELQEKARSSSSFGYFFADGERGCRTNLFDFRLPDLNIVKLAYIGWWLEFGIVECSKGIKTPGRSEELPVPDLWPFSFFMIRKLEGCG